MAAPRPSDREPRPHPELAGRTALVTGAGRRIGRAVALHLARRGCRIAVHVGASLDAGQALVDELRRSGRQAELFPADQRSVAEIEAACDAAEEHFGGIDLLVNSAALWPKAELESMTQEDFDLALEVNLRGPFFFARRLGLAMRERGRGAIINIADVSGDRPFVDSLPYCAAKAGLVSITYGLAKALAPKVRVNAIGPGPILFPEGYPAEAADRDRRATLLGREGSPDDIAAAVEYLATAPNVTGVLLPVDGGYRFGI